MSAMGNFAEVVNGLWMGRTALVGRDCYLAEYCGLLGEAGGDGEANEVDADCVLLVGGGSEETSL